MDGHHIYFWDNTTSGCIEDNAIEQLGPENMVIAVGILSVGALEPDVTLGVFYFPPPHWLNVYVKIHEQYRANGLD